MRTEAILRPDTRSKRLSGSGPVAVVLAVAVVSSESSLRMFLGEDMDGG